MHSGRCILGQCAKHNSFEYNTVHHSWRQYYTVLVCAKLSYAGDSWQTLAQTIHGLHQGRGHCCHLSEERWEDRKSGTHAGDDMGHSSRSASFLLFIWKSSEKDAEVGTQLGHYDDQQRPVRCFFCGILPCKRLENGHQYKCFDTKLSNETCSTLTKHLHLCPFNLCALMWYHWTNIINQISST